jgi:hypothetical protein
LKAIEDIHIADEEGTDNFKIVFEMVENKFIKNAPEMNAIEGNEEEQEKRAKLESDFE